MNMEHFVSLPRNFVARVEMNKKADIKTEEFTGDQSKEELHKKSKGSSLFCQHAPGYRIKTMEGGTAGSEVRGLFKKDVHQDDEQDTTDLPNNLIARYEVPKKTNVKIERFDGAIMKNKYKEENVGSFYLQYDQNYHVVKLLNGGSPENKAYGLFLAGNPANHPKELSIQMDNLLGEKTKLIPTRYYGEKNLGDSSLGDMLEVLGSRFIDWVKNWDCKDVTIAIFTIVAFVGFISFMALYFSSRSNNTIDCQTNNQLAEYKKALEPDIASQTADTVWDFATNIYNGFVAGFDTPSNPANEAAAKGIEYGFQQGLQWCNNTGNVTIPKTA